MTDSRFHCRPTLRLDLALYKFYFSLYYVLQSIGVKYIFCFTVFARMFCQIYRFIQFSLQTEQTVQGHVLLHIIFTFVNRLWLSCVCVCVYLPIYLSLYLSISFQFTVLSLVWHIFGLIIFHLPQDCLVSSIYVSNTNCDFFPYFCFWDEFVWPCKDKILISLDVTLFNVIISISNKLTFISC